MTGALSARTVAIAGRGGDEIEAYLVEPEGPGPHGGVVVIHHLPGYDRATKEITRRFGELGYHALCPNLYSREAPGLSPDQAVALIRERGGVPDDQVVGDVAGAAAQLRSMDTSNGKVAVIGYCSGGRQAVLAACSIDLDAAIDCYGPGVTGDVPAGAPFCGNLVSRLPDLGCPLLGLFGNDDSRPSSTDVEELDGLLRQHGKDYEFHRYDGAGHAFFAVDRDTYRVPAANDGWQRIAAFIGDRLHGS